MTILQILLLVSVGFCGGVLTTVAGGSSFVTFPALIFVGLTPMAANITNFVALFFAVPLALATSYRGELAAIGRGVLPGIAIGATGGAIGAGLLLWMGESGFGRAVPYLMLLATLMFAGGPLMRSWLLPRAHGAANVEGLLCRSLMFVLSIYCGYFGAGVGMMLLGVLAAFGYDDIHKANAMKNVVAGVGSVVATTIYGLAGPVAWTPALIMMVGGLAGAYAGGKIAKSAPQGLLRGAITTLGTVFTIYLFLH
jgi:uncharacterized protein